MRAPLLGQSFRSSTGERTAVFVVHLSEDEVKACEILRRCGGAFRFTITSLQNCLDAEPMLVEIDRVAYTLDNLMEEPTVAVS